LKILNKSDRVRIPCILSLSWKSIFLSGDIVIFSKSSFMHNSLNSDMTSLSFPYGSSSFTSEYKSIKNLETGSFIYIYFILLKTFHRFQIDILYLSRIRNHKYYIHALQVLLIFYDTIALADNYIMSRPYQP
jgi:hypothetical protein